MIAKIICYTRNNPFKALSILFIALILIILIFSTVSSSGENKRLKRAINEKELQIKKLESQKIAIFESIKKDSLKIAARDAVILDLSKKEDSLINNLKYFKNEKFKIKRHYVNSNVTERIRLFSSLATETDSIRQ